MAFKWTEGQHRSGNILDADEFNTSFNAFKGEINGGLDRENLPNASVSNDELAPNAFVKYAVQTGIRLQGTGVYTARFLNNAGANIDQTFRAINYNTYAGGWRTNEAQKINKLFQEGMLHIEYNGWYWLRNHLATANVGRSTDFLQIWCQFELTLDGNPVATSGYHYQNVGQMHLVADVPISTGKHEIALRWRISPNEDPNLVVTPTVALSRPIFYYDGGQITVVNRYR
jgi:hypothetical protein